MRLFYIANIRIPTEKAHGVAIVKSCEAFAKAGVDVTLVVPNRRTPFEKSVFETYGIRPVFAMRFLPTVDLIREKSGKLAFVIQTLTFYACLIAYLLFKDRETILYTREPHFLPLSRLGFRVVFECHLISNDRAAFFRRARGADRIVVISDALKRAFIEAGFDADAILVAPSGVDLAIFDTDVSKEDARRQLDLPTGGVIAVYTGNFTTMGADKGIADIIRALPDASGITFVGAGGSDKDRANYSAQAAERGVSDRVVLRGPTTQNILAVYQKAADILLMPFPDTPHYRNHMSPVKMFEYMVARRPIIASDLPTIREVLNEDNAIIVPPGDPAALATALQNVATDPAGSEILATKAYQDVSRYSWKARTERVLTHICGTL